MSRRATGWVLVGIQMALLALLVLLPKRSGWTDLLTGVGLVGGGITLVGVAIAVWGILGLSTNLTAHPEPLAHGSLQTAGMYRFVRHPIYLGILIAAVGFTIAVGSWWQAGVTGALFGLFSVKYRWEDRLLAEKYGEEWRQWAQQTGGLFPRFSGQRR